MNTQWNICLDYNEEMVLYAETFELLCQSCGATKELFSQEGYTGQPTLTFSSDTHLHKTLKKYKILDDVNTVILDGREVCDPERYHLMANYINQYRRVDGMSVFCMIFFKLFLLKLGRERKKSLSVFLPTFQKL